MNKRKKKKKKNKKKKKQRKEKGWEIVFLIVDGKRQRGQEAGAGPFLYIYIIFILYAFIYG